MDMDSAGVEMTDNPLFSHTYAAHHPTFRFNDVIVPEGNRIGTSGDGQQGRGPRRADIRGTRLHA